MLLPYLESTDKYDLTVGNLIEAIPTKLTFTENISLINILKFHINNKQLLCSDPQLVSIIKRDNDDSVPNIAYIESDLRSVPLELDNIKAYPISTTNLAGYDLNIEIKDTEKSIECQLNYKANLYDQEFIQRIAGYVNKLFISILSDPTLPITSYDILSTEESNLLRHYSLSSIATNRPLQYTNFLDYFYYQVSSCPDAIAVAFESQRLSYAELDTISDQWASHLDKVFSTQYDRQINSDDFVLLCTDKNSEMVISILAILKAGAAYVPVASVTPNEQLKFIIEDSQTRLILTQDHIAKKREAFNRADLIVLTFKELRMQPVSEIYNKKTISPSDLVYMIYTSGTTGKPKGVMLEHLGVVYLIEFYRTVIKMNADDRRLQYSSLNFDASVPDILVTLAFGASVYIISENDRLSTIKLYDFMAENHITNALIPPAMLRLLPKMPLPALRFLESGGEVSDTETVNFWSKDVTFFNLYGPTEGTVCATYKTMSPDVSIFNIGKPLPGYICYILDQYLKPIPIGVVGELCISGPALARGYKNLPNVSAKKFINNPFNDAEDSLYKKMYKTGDLVRWLPNGDIEYIGRNDSQIKIRGFRIELDSISSIAMSHQTIQNAVAVVNEYEGRQDIVLYYIAQEKISSKELTKWIAQYLPKYMLPSFYILIKEVPVTLNGKVDKRKLPAIDVSSRLHDYVKPTNILEKQLANIWQTLFKIDKISISDNFFSIGGQSILAIQMCAEIAEKLHLQCEVKYLFKHPTIAKLAEYLSLHAISSDNIPKINVQDRNSLSYAQERMWFPR